MFNRERCNPSPAVPASVIGRRNILAAAASDIHSQIDRDGGDPEEVLFSAGIGAESLADGRNPLDLGAYVAMMEIAAKHTGNDNFGLDYGQRFTPEMLGLIGASVLASPNLGAALTALVELFPYHQQATETCLAYDGQLVRLEYRIIDGDIIDRRQDAELTMGMFVNMLRRCLGNGWVPEEVHYEHPRPEHWRAHENAFNAPAEFGQRTNAIVFHRRSLDVVMPAADLQRFSAVREELRNLARDGRQPDLMSRIRGEIRSRLSQGGSDLVRVSHALGIPRWTLQRRLGEIGMTFADTLDSVRRDMAWRYLNQPHLSITDIAFLLGYSELSVFSRACRRWYGVSPQQYRAQWLKG